jgi:hypothetical protein
MSALIKLAHSEAIRRSIRDAVLGQGGPYHPSMDAEEAANIALDEAHRIGPEGVDFDLEGYAPVGGDR